MSAKEEVQRITEEVISAAAKGDFVPFVNLLDDEVQVFDHVPYLFENKQSFVEYLQGASTGAESLSFVFHQPTYRAINETTAIVNSYDRFTMVPKGGMPKVQCGRTTFVYAKKGAQWRIVNAHFSPLPKE